MSTKTPSESMFYPVVYDEFYNEQCLRENDAWETAMCRLSKLQLLKDFVRRKMGIHEHQSVDVSRNPAKGCFNLMFKFRIINGDGTVAKCVALRFPQGGYSPSALVSEKIENEVRWMQFFEEQNIAPVPHIYSWSAVRGSDGMGSDIDPYILMDFVEGDTLSACLSRWEDASSLSEAETAKREVTFRDLATILLELSRPRFDKIGSITKSAAATGSSDSSWNVTQRPLTYDMYSQLTIMPDFPIDAWPAGPLHSAQELKGFVADLRGQQMMCLRNINIPGTWSAKGHLYFEKGNTIDMKRALTTARGRFLSCRAMSMPEYAAHLVNHNSNKTNNDNGNDERFAIFCPDLSAADILVDPATGKIIALLDLEFTNAMPAAFAQDPPTWISPYNFGLSVIHGMLPLWKRMHKPSVDALLAALERVEIELGADAPSPLLSAQMRESWTKETYLVNCALNKYDMTDILFHGNPELFPTIDPSVYSGDVEEYQEHTRRQIAAYEQARLSGES